MSEYVPKFGAVEAEKGRWSSFGTSFLVQGAAIVLLINITIAFPQAPKLLSYAKFEKITLVAEQPEVKPVPKPQVKPIMPAPEVKLVAKVFDAPKVVLNPDMPKIPEPKVKIQQPFPKFDSPRVDLPPGPKVGKKVEKTIFASTGSSAQPTLNMPAHKVQTGGFGDPNGVAPNPNAKGPANIAAVGSFDLPSGPGQGNGTGGARGARGTVVSAGFGNGTAVQGGGGRGNGGVPKVQNTVFQQVDTTPEPVRRKETSTVPKTSPVAVHSKPTPVYTDEARQQHIEGEVLLDVVFGASGDVQVIRVARGLGHGLDEAAIRAAKNIKFSPATRDGQAVDFEARIHIVFQMS
jgi:TonB family protein